MNRPPPPQTFVTTSNDDNWTGGNGDDSAIYDATLNAGDHDRLNGGAGQDTLILRLSAAEWFNQALQNDIARFLNWAGGRGNNGTFEFRAFDLDIRNFEAIQIFVDGRELSARDDGVNARDDRFASTENGSVSGNVLANDRADDLARDARVIDGPDKGRLTFNSDGTFVFDTGTDFDWLAAGQMTTVTFTYKLTDADGDFDTAEVTVTVTGTNDAPIITGGIVSGTVTEIADGAPGENATPRLLTGEIEFADADRGDHHTASFTPQGAGYLGAFSLTLADDDDGDGGGHGPGNGHHDHGRGHGYGHDHHDHGSGRDRLIWQFSIDDSAIDFLAAGETRVQQYLVSIRDSSGAVVTQMVTITLVGADDGGVNIMPETNVAMATGAEDSSAIAIQLSGSDADGFIAAFNLLDLPTNGRLYADAALTIEIASPSTIAATANAANVYFVPARDFSGTAFLHYASIDNSGAQDATPATATITITPVNDAPVVAAPIPDRSSPEDAAFSFMLPAGTFSDVDDATLTLAASLANDDPLPAWLAFDAASRTFSGIPPRDFNGTLQVRVTATDASALSTSDDFTLNITPVNDAPVVAAPISDQASPEDAAFSFTLPAGTFSDVDDATLTLAAVLVNGDPLPAWLTFDATSRTFSGIPPRDFNGTLQVRVTATDASALSTSDDFTLNITPVNDAPVALDDANPSDPVIEAGVAVGDAIAVGNVLANDSDVDAGDTLTVATPGTFTGTYGTLVLGADGAYTYTLDDGDADTQALAQDAAATDSFGYTIRDAAGATATATLRIAITGGNDAPVALDDANPSDPVIEAGVAVGDAIAVGNVLANDSDVDAGDTLTVATPGTFTGTYGTLVLGADGAYTYTLDDGDADTQALAQDAAATDSFGYTIRDAAGATATATLRIAITGGNDAPVVAAPIPDRSSPEDALFNYTLPSTTFSDVDDAMLTLVASLANGDPLPEWLAFDAASRTFSGIPPRDFNGALQARVTATDPGGAFVADTFLLAITPVNDAPIVANPIPDQAVGSNPIWEFAVPADTFTDVDDASLTLTATRGNGTALPDWLHFGFNAGTGQWELSGDTYGVNGSLDIKITARDPGGLTAESTFSLYINAEPALTGTPTTYQAVISNGSTYELPIVQLIPGWQPGHGVPSLSFGGGGYSYYFDMSTYNFVITPPSNFSGAVEISYVRPPSTSLPGGNEDVSYTIHLSELIDGWTDPDGDTLGVENLVATHGTITRLDDITWRFDPAANYHGSVVLTFDVVDGHGGRVPASLDFVVSSINDAPVGADGARVGTEDTPLVFATADFAFTDPNDGNPTNTFFGVKVDVMPSIGALERLDYIYGGNDVVVGTYWRPVALNELIQAAEIDAGHLRYIPPADASGTPITTFGFHVVDDGGTGNGGIDTDPIRRSMAISIDPANDAPYVAHPIANQAFALNAPWSFTIPADTFADVDSPSLTYSVAAYPGDTPPAGFQFDPLTRTLSGTGQSASFDVGFVVTASDGEFSTSTTVFVHFRSAPEYLGNAALAFSTFEDQPLTVHAADLLRDWVDPDGGSLTVRDLKVINENLAVVADVLTPVDPETWTFTPPSNFNGMLFFSYIVRDDEGQEFDRTEAALTVVPVNDAPAGVDRAVTIAEDHTHTFTAADFAFTDPNDMPPDGLYGAILASNPVGGQIYGSLSQLKTPGSLIVPGDVFRPDPNFNGTASFQFQIVDDGGTAGGGTDIDPILRDFTLNVTPVNDAPRLDHPIDDLRLALNAPLNYVIPANAFSDADGDPLTWTATLANGAPLPAWLHFDPESHAFTADPQTTHMSVDLMVTVDDGAGGTRASNQFSITFNVAPVLGTPATLPHGTEDTVYVLHASDLLQGWSDGDGDTLSVANLTANHGAITPAGAGIWHFTPAPNYNGLVSIGYQVTDGAGGSTSVTLPLTLDAVNDPALILQPTDPDVTEGDAVNGMLTATGIIPIFDVETSEAYFQTSVVAVGSPLGQLSIDSVGHYAYTVANDDVRFLGQDQTHVDQFRVTSADGTQQTVSFTIHGVSGAPVVSAPIIADLWEGSGARGDNILSTTAHPATELGVLGMESFLATAAGGIPQFSYDLTSANLSDRAVLSVQAWLVSPAASATEAHNFLDNQVAIFDAVAHGMSLVFNDPSLQLRLDPSVLPGLDGLGFWTTADVTDVGFELGTPLASGLGGALDDASLDQISPRLGFLRSTLPAGALVHLTTENPEQVVAFSYSYGAGTILVNSLASVGHLPFGYYTNVPGNTYSPAYQAFTTNELGWALQLAHQTTGLYVVDALANASTTEPNVTLSVIDVPANLPAGVTYDAGTHSFAFDRSDPAYDHLGFGTAPLEVVVNYQVFDGFLATPAQVKFIVHGTNDAPVVTGTITVAEHAIDNGTPVNSPNALINASDVDDGGLLFVIIPPGSLPPGVGYDGDGKRFVLDPTHPAYDHLGVGQSETVTVDYFVSDGTARVPARVVFTIDGADDVPVVVDIARAPVANEDGASVTIDAFAGLNGIDDNDPYEVTFASALPAGVSYDAPTHGFTFDPRDPTAHALFNHLPAGQQVTFDVSYDVTSGGITVTGAVARFTVAGTNDGVQVSGAIVATILEGESLDQLAMLANVSDPDDGAAPRLYYIEQADVGFSWNNTTPGWSFNPQASFAATSAIHDALAENQITTARLIYLVGDGIQSPGTYAAININVVGVNDDPVIHGAATLSGVVENSGFAALNAFANVTDVDLGDHLTAVNMSALPTGITYDAQSHGFVVDSNDAAFDSIPTGVARSYVVTYDVHDGHVTVSGASAIIEITGVNDAPVALGESYSLEQDGALTFDVRTNDTDSDTPHAQLAAIVVAQPAHGALTQNLDGTFTYAPDSGYYGQDSFSYRINDGALNSAIATAIFDVARLNTAPTAANDLVSVDLHLETDAVGSAIANDSDGQSINTDLRVFGARAGDEGAGGVFTAVQQPNPSATSAEVVGAYGTLHINAFGGYSYHASGVVNGTVTDVFTYQLGDPGGLTDTAEIRITLDGNLAPLAVDDSIIASTTIGQTHGNVLANDTDDVILTASGSPAVTSIAHGVVSALPGEQLFGAYGHIVVQADGSFTYFVDQDNQAVLDLGADDTLTDNFTYHIADVGGLDSAATINVIITGNAPPVAVADGAVVTRAYPTRSGNVLTNDSDPEGAPLNVVSVIFDGNTISLVNGVATIEGAFGALVIHADGAYSYQLDPANAQVRALEPDDLVFETFTYGVTDGIATSTTDLVVDISGSRNLAPHANIDGFNLNLNEHPDGTITGNLLVNDSDPEGSALRIQSLDSIEFIPNSTISADLWNSDYHLGLTAQGDFLFESFGSPGTYTIAYGIADEFGLISTASIQVTVRNDGMTGAIPRPESDTALIEAPAGANASYRAAIGNVLDNDVDADGNALVVSGLSRGAHVGTVGSAFAGEHGVLKLNSDGTYFYTVNPLDPMFRLLANGESLTDTFSYVASDGVFSASADLVVTAVKGDADIAPHANGDVLVANFNGYYHEAVGNILTNDSDPEGALLSLATFDGHDLLNDPDYIGTGFWWTSVDIGSVQIQFDDGFGQQGLIRLLPDLNKPEVIAALNGDIPPISVTFTYEAMDQSGQLAATTVTFLVGSAADPIVVPQSASDDIEIDLVNWVYGEVAAFNNDWPQPLLITTITPLATGIAVDTNGNPTIADGTIGTLTVDSTSGVVGYDVNAADPTVIALRSGEILYRTFTYETVPDVAGQYRPQSADITVRIIGVNDVPVAHDDAGVTSLAAGGVATGNLLVNDTDPEGDALGITQFYNSNNPGNVGTAGSAVQGNFGSLTVNADGSWTYIADLLNAPAWGYAEDFVYWVGDGEDITSANLHIDIHENAPPIVSPGSTIAANEHEFVELPDLLAAVNATDLEGDPLSIVPYSFRVVEGNVTSYLYVSFQAPDQAHPNGYYSLNADDLTHGALADGEHGTYRLEFDVTDGTQSTPAYIDIDVTGVADWQSFLGYYTVMAPVGHAAVPFSIQLSDPDTDLSALSFRVTSITGNGGELLTNTLFGGFALQLGDYSGLNANDLAFVPGSSPGEGTLTYQISEDGFQSWSEGTIRFATDDAVNGSTLDAAQHLGTGSSPATGLLIGGAGDDTLTGFAWGSVLTGGDGSDHFVFQSASFGIHITDFAPGIDHIDLDSGALSYFDLVPGQQLDLVTTDYVFSQDVLDHIGTDPFFVYDNEGQNAGQLYLVAGTGGNLSANYLAVLDNVAAINSSGLHII